MRKWTSTLALIFGLAWFYFLLISPDELMGDHLVKEDRTYSLQVENPDPSIVSDSASNLPSEPSSELSIEFLNVASVKIQSGDDILLTDPFYSNPPLSDVLTLRRLVPDVVAVQKLVRDPQKVDAVLLGHGHYDHILDLPALIALLNKNATVVGNSTIQNMLHGLNELSNSTNWIGLPKQQLASHEQAGHWYALPHTDIRFLPILSEHAPQIDHIVLAEGSVDKPMPQLPLDALEWKNGVPITYLVKMGGYTVYFQSSAGNEPYGHITEQQRDEVGEIDVAILCVASFENVESYPEHLIEFYHPKHLVLIHWDRFWHPRNTQEPDLLPGLDMNQFISRAKDAAGDYPLQISMPMPGVTLRFKKS